MLRSCLVALAAVAVLVGCRSGGKVDTVARLADALKKEGVAWETISEKERGRLKAWGTVKEAFELAGEGLLVEVYRARSGTLPPFPALRRGEGSPPLTAPARSQRTGYRAEGRQKSETRTRKSEGRSQLSVPVRIGLPMTLSVLAAAVRWQKTESVAGPSDGTTQNPAGSDGVGAAAKLEEAGQLFSAVPA